MLSKYGHDILGTQLGQRNRLVRGNAALLLLLDATSSPGSGSGSSRPSTTRWLVRPLVVVFFVRLEVDERNAALVAGRQPCPHAAPNARRTTAITTTLPVTCLLLDAADAADSWRAIMAILTHTRGSGGTVLGLVLALLFAAGRSSSSSSSSATCVALRVALAWPQFGLVVLLGRGGRGRTALISGWKKKRKENMAGICHSRMSPLLPLGDRVYLCGAVF
mmetsp:Transcript_43421/g.122988  ORF Transcript_43421/g.122988 Transcript_43421/m.122988 type:complete len:220 (-) Transcript_43421:100-759(-)